MTDKTVTSERLSDRVDRMADEFFIENSTENDALHAAAADIRALKAERDELRKALEAVRSLVKDAGLANHRVAARNLQEVPGVATAALAPDDK